MTSTKPPRSLLVALLLALAGAAIAGPERSPETRLERTTRDGTGRTARDERSREHPRSFGRELGTRRRGGAAALRDRRLTPQTPAGRDRASRASLTSETLSPDEMALAEKVVARLGVRESGARLADRASQPDVFGPLAAGPELADLLGPLSPGGLRLSTGEEIRPSKGVTREVRAWLKAARIERAKQRGLEPPQRSVVIDGGGPAGALAAIHAYNHFPNMTVTIIEQREASTLPIVWNNRQQSRDILKFIDPVLEGRVFDGKAGRIRSGEYLQGDKQVIGNPQLEEGDASRLPANAKEIAASPSTWQTQSRDEVTLYWERLVELERADQARVERERGEARAAGRDPAKIQPRLRLLRGYKVVDLPADGEQRKVVVAKVEERLQQLGSDGKPAVDARGQKIQRAFKAGDKVPPGWERVTVEGDRENLGAPDDLLIAEGVNSNSRKLAGAELVDVGPATRYIAGFVEGIKVKSLANAQGENAGNDGVVRRSLKLVKDPTTGGETALRAIALSAEHLSGTWALPEVDARLDFDNPASIEAYFGSAMSRDAAIKTYYKQEIAPVLGVKPEDIPDSAFSFGPGPFVLQSHVAGPPAADAKNVHLIGDARGNSHFLTSLGKVTGTGVHQMALNQYWTALASRRSGPLATALLERRLDAGTRAWLKAGLQEFASTGGVNLGAEAVKRIRDLNTGKKFTSQTGDFKVDDRSLANDPTVNNK